MRFLWTLVPSVLLACCCSGHGTAATSSAAAAALQGSLTGPDVGLDDPAAQLEIMPAAYLAWTSAAIYEGNQALARELAYLGRDAAANALAAGVSGASAYEAIWQALDTYLTEGQLIFEGLGFTQGGFYFGNEDGMMYFIDLPQLQEWIATGVSPDRWSGYDTAMEQRGGNDGGWDGFDRSYDTGMGGYRFADPVCVSPYDSTLDAMGLPDGGWDGYDREPDTWDGTGGTGGHDPCVPQYESATPVTGFHARGPLGGGAYRPDRFRLSSQAEF